MGGSWVNHTQSHGVPARKTTGNCNWEPLFIADPKLTSSSRTAGLSDTVKVSVIAWPTAATTASQT